MEQFVTTFDKALYNQYESLCLTRLSPNFILRDFMFSAEAAACEHSNFPSDDVEQVIKSGKQLCTQVLEPVLEHFGRFALTFGYQNRITIERNWTCLLYTSWTLLPLHCMSKSISKLYMSQCAKSCLDI